MKLTIPPAALEAGARALCEECGNGWPTILRKNQDAMRRRAMSAAVAVLKAWPGMVDHPETALSPRCIWLPFMEKPDDKI